MSELFEQTVIEKPRIDKEAGIIFNAHILGVKSSNGYDYAINGMKSAYSRYEQMPVGIDHDYQSTPLKVAGTWGTLTNPTCNENGIWADLHYLKSHPLTEQVIEDVERGTGLFSLSSVNGGVIQKGKVVEQFSPMRCDLVVKGATTKTLLEQNTMETKEEVVVEQPVVEEVKTVHYEQFNDICVKVTELFNKVVELEKRFVLHSEYIAPKTTMEQEIAAAVKGIDLKEFWQDKTKE